MSRESKVFDIRPKVIFKEIEKKFPNSNVNFTVNIPTTQIGGLTLLESSILVSFVKLLSPLNIFEFGTYMGATSTLFALNSLKDTKVVTLDIDPEDNTLSKESSTKDILVDDRANDNYLRTEFVNSGAIYINRCDELTKSKIEQIYQDSRTLNLEDKNLVNKFDLIFIDGGHDYDTVKNDTQKALKMSRDDAVIIWHDYRSSIHSDVTTFIDEFSRENRVFYIENTMLVFMLKGRYKDLISINC